MPPYSVVIPAYNEAQFLPHTLERLFESMRAMETAGEVVVVDNNSSDDTARIARDFGATVVFEKINQISRARNTGARSAASPYLIFLDADTLVSATLLEKALSNLRRKNCCGGGAVVAADRPLRPFYRNVLKFWNRLSVRLHLAAGSFIYCRKDGFEAIGGFSEEVYFSEEIWFSIYYRRWGKRQGKEFVIIDDAPVVTSMRKLDWSTKSPAASMILPVLLFPLAARRRSLCGFWYRRPDDESSQKNQAHPDPGRHFKQ